MSDDTAPDDLADMQKEPHESEGHQVLRHLQGIHAAAASLVLNGKSRQFTQSLVVGLVEVAPIKLGPEGPDLMTSEEVIQEFLSRYPASSPEARDSIEDIIRNNHIKAKFTGTTSDTYGAYHIFFAWFMFCQSWPSGCRRSPSS